MKEDLKEIPNALRAGNDNEDGQSTVELTLMLGILLFLLFMIFQAGVTYMATQYIKYAAFMGARTYAVKGEPEGRAVIKSYLGASGKKLYPFIKAESDFVVPIKSSDKKEVGFRVTYRSLFFIPFMGRGVASSGFEEVKEADKFLELKVRSRMKNENLICNDPTKIDNRTGSNGGC